mmetsp:Transcript_27874/g.89760  ORF Transcript_27874/g.89760 Transcript_27874/m.89760 type:complete len:192 (-) Transcript_27874:112-687(-)
MMTSSWMRRGLALFSTCQEEKEEQEEEEQEEEEEEEDVAEDELRSRPRRNRRCRRLRHLLWLAGPAHLQQRLAARLGQVQGEQVTLGRCPKSMKHLSRSPVVPCGPTKRTHCHFIPWRWLRLQQAKARLTSLKPKPMCYSMRHLRRHQAMVMPLVYDSDQTCLAWPLANQLPHKQTSPCQNDCARIIRVHM